MIEIIAYLLISFGLALILIGLIGILKNKNFYSRVMIASIIDTAGFISIILGIIFLKGFSFFSIKVILILMLMLFLNPLSTHTVVRGAYTSGFRIGDDK